MQETRPRTAIMVNRPTYGSAMKRRDIYTEMCLPAALCDGGGETYLSYHYMPSVALQCALLTIDEVCGDVLPDGVFWEWCGSTQGGGGIDHLDKVQQKSVQIEIFRTPGAITTQKDTICNYNMHTSYVYSSCSYEHSASSLSLSCDYASYADLTFVFISVKTVNPLCATSGSIVTHLVTSAN